LAKRLKRGAWKNNKIVFSIILYWYRLMEVWIRKSNLPLLFLL
jgi:hypothetical protein